MELIKSYCSWTRVQGLVLMGGAFKQWEVLWRATEKISRTPHCGFAFKRGRDSKDAAGVSVIEMNREDWDGHYHNDFEWPWSPAKAEVPAILEKLKGVPSIHINMSFTWAALLLQLLYTMLQLPWSPHVQAFYRQDPD